VRSVSATRYVTPLREGGSLPAIIEADDDGMYVMKFRGAGQGPKMLIAELVAGEIGRALGLPVPEIVFVDLDTELARTEADSEIRHLLQASGGLNLGLDYRPGALNFDPAAPRSDATSVPDAQLASAIVWFDAFVANVDRTARNTNMLVWHRRLHLIDHGAALYFHHDWSTAANAATDPFTRIRDHVLLDRASALEDIDAQLATRLATPVIEAVVAHVPDAWLLVDAPFTSADEHRRAYVDHFTRRLAARHHFVEEAIRARAAHL
jgi:hypothetical protein